MPSIKTVKISLQGDFPDGPVVGTSPVNAVCADLIPGLRAKIPHALQPKKPRYKTEAIM